MNLTELTAISPIDGRYFAKTGQLSTICSEFGLIKYRLTVEIQWLKALAHHSEIKELPSLTDAQKKFLDDIVQNFSLADAQAVKDIEKETNHDLKAVEYFIKQKLATNDSFAHAQEFIHFACTSEDINNLAYALMIKEAKETLLSTTLDTVNDTFIKAAHKYADIPMLARTHGQAASPTTVGKEFANIAMRLKKQVASFYKVEIEGKINGATGNYNAHSVAYPEVDWKAFTKQFVESLDLKFNSHTTQIEPHDYIAELFDALARINTILIDASRDMWGYICMDYFTQKLQKNEVGSSTMPHKINPIDFENAEGNLGVANALLNHFSQKLPISRWQRDLSDSTVLRNIGVAFAHCLVSYQSLLKGLSKLEINKTKLSHDLHNNWGVLGEALQTVMRRYGIEKPYEKLKLLTRGKTISPSELRDFIHGLEIPEAVAEKLIEMTPENYIGLASELANEA